MSSEMGVAAWYKHKNLFITGGSGFVGVCLIEKLLRCIPDVGTIYLLLRPKRGKEIAERLEDLKKNPIFEKLKESPDYEAAFARLKAVGGDVSQPELGLNAQDRKLLTDNVNVIFHSAATLDFADGLKETVETNLLGTRRTLELAAQCGHLDAFVHVSSAYVNSFLLKTEEIIYPLKQDADEVIKMTEALSQEELSSRTPQLLGEHPNTYTFTKQMAEHEVQKMEQRFPCSIVRPSMIIGAWKEPIPGWTSSKNGPQGFIMGAAKGVIRRLPVGQDLVYDYIPVDIVVNHLIVSGFHSGMSRNSQVQIYHSTSSTRAPFKWNNVGDKVNFYLHKFPLKSAVWYPHLKFVPSVQRFRISAFFVHMIPAFFLDLVTRISGGRPILMKLHRNVNSSLDRLEKFIFNEWSFSATKTTELHKWLNAEDKKQFNLDLTDLDWSSFFDDLTKGVRRYLNNEKMSNIKAARSKHMILMTLHLALQGLILTLIWYLVSAVLGLPMSKTAFSVPIAYVLFGLL